MTHTHGERALVLALFTAIGCADPATRVIAPFPSKEIAAAPESPDRERVALTKIARLVAVAMDNEPARQRLKRDMRAAPFREHKLQLTSYLRSKEGRALLERMTSASGDSESALFATLGAVRPLEFYMPVAAQREKWTGKADVLVVSQLDQSSPIVAFDQSGQEITLDRNIAPAQPTLSIVSVETRFDKPMSPGTSRNVRDEGGNAIGTLEPMELTTSSVMDCGDTCGGGGGGSGSTGSTAEPGLYLEFSRILDAKEPWFRGAPEIEVHVHGPTSGAYPTYGEDLSCAGEQAYELRRRFNQDDGFWSGRVMLYSAEQTIAYTNKFTEGFHVFFWEDDNEPCTLKLDSNALMEFVHSAASAFSMIAIKLIPKAPPWLVAGAFVATLFVDSGSWLQTNDDFLGIAVAQEQAGYAYPGNTHVIMDGTTLNGRATIVYR